MTYMYLFHSMIVASNTSFQPQVCYLLKDSGIVQDIKNIPIYVYTDIRYVGVVTGQGSNAI